MGYNFRLTTHANPALHYLMPDSSLLQLSITGNLAPQAPAPIPQLGTGQRTMTVDANTLQQLSTKNRMWGNASYRNGVTYNVTWNETAHYDRLRPYVMGDGRGGDMHFEQYELNGGYAWQHRRMMGGITLGYCALSQYRSRDPRPNNTVSSLRANAGLACKITGKLALGISLHGEKYKQINELIYMNELGAQKEFHLTGLGNDFTRFSGTSNRAFYTGAAFGGSIDMSPVTDTGLSATIAYDLTYTKKILTDLNRIPINSLKITKVTTEVAWKHPSFGIKLQGDYSQRKGKDNMFGDAIGNVYLQIGAREQYTEDACTAHLTAFYESQAQNRWSWGIMPKISIDMLKAQHHDSGNEAKATQLSCALKGQGTWQVKRNRLHSSLMLMQRKNLHHELHLHQVATPELQQVLQDGDNYRAHDVTSVNWQLGYDRAILNGKVISLQLGWNHMLYLANSHSNEYELKITFTL